MKSRARTLAGKSIDAMLAAVEIYNKPNFAYREESYAILAINSWELLLKARILQLSNNRMNSILKYQRRQLADGTLSAKLYRVKNRSGTHLSVGIFGAIDLLQSEYGDKIDSAVRENLELICEVRDNAVHFMNKGFDISKLVQELGTACLRNYLILIRRWFAIDMSSYNFFLMPLAFVHEELQIEVVNLNADERKLIEFLRSRTSTSAEANKDGFNVALHLDIKFSRSKADSAQRVIVTNDPSATHVTLSEEDIREKYPWDFQILTTRMKKRYSNFVQNKMYHDLRKPLEEDERYCKKRYLDPAKTSGIGKCFYNPNIIGAFDEHYTKKS